MATLKKIYDSGVNLYVILRNQNLQIWNTQTQQLETYQTQNWTQYACSATEQGNTGLYYVITPENLPSDIYAADWRIREGATPVPADTCVGVIPCEWCQGVWYLPAYVSGIVATKTAAEETKTVAEETKTAAEAAKAAAEATAAKLLGPGSTPTVIHCRPGGKTLAGVRVWITADATGLDLVAGPQYSDDLGRTVFLLDAGQYYVWRRMVGWTFQNPQAITVAT